MNKRDVYGRMDDLPIVKRFSENFSSTKVIT